jgi:hypothetical protein
MTEEELAQALERLVAEQLRRQLPPPHPLRPHRRQTVRVSVKQAEW